jgi:hypothetical protein
MKKDSLYFLTFLFVLFFLVGCSSDKGADITEELKWDSNIDQKYAYGFINGGYVLTKMYSKTNGTITKPDGVVEDNSSVDSTDLPNEELGEYNNFEIINIDDNQVVLLNSIYSSEEGYNTKTIWKFTCKIMNGTLAAFNRGETIEAESIDDSDFDNAQEALLKAIIVKEVDRADPYKTSIDLTSSNHVFKISKRNIYESSNSSLSALVKVIKEVKE